MRGGRVLVVAALVLTACTREGPAMPDAGALELDAGVSDSGVDAGTFTDGGARDGGLELDSGVSEAPDASVVLTATTDDLAVHLAWVADFEPLGWYVVRNGAVIRTFDSSARAFDDLLAPPGALGAFDASASIGMPTGVEIDWTTPAATAGDAQRYEVIAQLTSRLVSSNSIDAGRDAPHVVRWLVTRGDAGWSLSPTAEYLLDSTAPPPNVVVSDLASRAVPDDFSTSVVVIADASVSYAPQVVSYEVSAEPSGGVRAPSVTVTGSRGGNRVVFQWQRSIDDSPDAFVDLPYVHGRKWVDLDAVMNEGRFYRVVARSGVREWSSTPTRAFLVRPELMVWPWVVRDDGLAFKLNQGVFRPLQFDRAQVRQFFSLREKLCALFVDAGTQCFDPDHGLIESLSFSASRMIVGPPSYSFPPLACSDAVRDASVDCFPAFSVNAFEWVDVARVTNHSVCGHLADGGIRCSPRTSGPFVDLGPLPAGALEWWLIGDMPFTSWPNGLVQSGTDPPLLPVEDAGYAEPVWSLDGRGPCGHRLDGFVRCDGPDFCAPISREPMASVVELAGFSHGLTLTHRLRMRGGTRVSPPIPPVREVGVEFDQPVFIGADGRIEGYNHFTPGVDVTDRFVSLDLTPSSTSALTETGLVRTSDAAPPAGARFLKIAGRVGLLADGGLYSFDGLPPWGLDGPYTDLRTTLGGRTCARRVDRTWACNALGDLPAHVEQFAANCTLDARGRLQCSIAVPAPLAAMRFTRIRLGRASGFTLLLVSVDGVAFAWAYQAPQSVTEVADFDDLVDFQRSPRQACALRRDGTAFCEGDGMLPWADK